MSKELSPLGKYIQSLIDEYVELVPHRKNEHEFTLVYKFKIKRSNWVKIKKGDQTYWLSSAGARKELNDTEPEEKEG